MNWGLALKVGPYVVIAVLLGWIGWLKYDLAKVDGEIAKAVNEANEKSRVASDAAIVKVTAELSKAQATKETYVEKLVHAPATPADDACRKSERMRIGSAGVRAIVNGGKPEAERSVADAVRATVSGAGPGQR